MRYTILLSLLLVGCESKAGTGALVGGGLGAGAGALISPTAGGVLIGTAVGAATGAVIGASLDSADRDRVSESSPQTLNKIDNKEQLSLDDIIRMHNAGITDDKIIGTIDSTGSVYHLTTSDIQELKDAGVSQHVIDHMLQTAYH
ncbi:MAG: hypothetical protein JSS61_06100 [Verrucomicrobia bacterium]|nr:hypothetical protein [Verrucomicrobiota bacterium]